MGLGYEGWIRINNGTQTDYLLGSGGGVPKNRQRIESSSGYGGRIDGANQAEELEVGIGLPRTYDWTQWSGNINFDVSEGALTRQIIPWLFDRQRASTIDLKSRAGNTQSFTQCFWSNITLTGGANQLVNGSISFESIDRNSYTRGGDYIANKVGQTGNGSNSLLCDPPTNTFVPEPLWSEYESPIPGWYTKWIVNLSGMKDILLQDWSLTFSQDVVRFFACDRDTTAGTPEPSEPKYLAVGPMTIVFSGTFMFAGTKTGSTFINENFLSPDTITESQLQIANTMIYLSDMELTSDTDEVQQPDSLTVVSFDYNVYGLTSEEL